VFNLNCPPHVHPIWICILYAVTDGIREDDITCTAGEVELDSGRIQQLMTKLKVILQWYAESY
jgi:hypothetical protein